MRKALITGGAGFIGLNLAKHLIELGIEVDLIDDFSRGSNDAALASFCKQPGVRAIKLDMSVPHSSDSLGIDYDFIFHLAAIVGVKNVVRRAYDTLALNIALTTEALRLARRQKNISAFVFASTSEVYSGSEFSGLLNFPTKEDSTLALPPLQPPRTTYMLSKIYGEALSLQSGVRSIIVRPHNVYGPRMGGDHVIPELIRRMQSADPRAEIDVYSPQHSRTFCYIDDAVQMISRLAMNPATVGGTWNIGTEAPEFAIMRVAEIIRDVVKADVQLIPGRDTPGSPMRRCPSMECTNAMTGYYDRMSLHDGIMKTYEWYREHEFSTAA